MFIVQICISAKSPLSEIPSIKYCRYLLSLISEVFMYSLHAGCSSRSSLYIVNMCSVLEPVLGMLSPVSARDWQLGSINQRLGQTGPQQDCVCEMDQTEPTVVEL